MYSKNNFCVIMAGGIGSRFWPMSTKERPKQFLDIMGVGESLLQQTYKRFLKLCRSENIFIATNERYSALVKEQIAVDDRQILCEPVRKNTAPCIAYSSYKIEQINPNANIIVAPSDHLVLKEIVFLDTINAALKKTATSNLLITLGIKPTRPDTGYGYIQFDPLGKGNIRKVKTFTEKPNHQLARKFIDSGDFYWNSGIFVWSVKSIIKALERHLPEIDSLFREGKDEYNTEGEKKFIEKVYPFCKKISIDYGVMEKSDNVFVILTDFGWSDLGTWGSLYDNLPKNEHGNAIKGNNTYLYETKNCIINIPNEKTVILQGLKDFIVVEAGNTLLICRKKDEQKIRQMVNDVTAKRKK